MKRSSIWKWLPRATAFIAAATLAGCTEGIGLEQENEAAEADNASARARAQEVWYNEREDVTRAPHGGPWSAEYRRFVETVLLEAAVRTTILMLRGIDANKEFIERQRRAIEGEG